MKLDLKTSLNSIDWHGWLSVLGAFGLYYAALAAFTAALFAAALHVAHDSGDPRTPCPFPELAVTNCYGFCAGPPQLMRAWELAGGDEEARAEASQRIRDWIAGNYSFVWSHAGFAAFAGLNVTNQFYRKLQCCKLLDGVALTQANVDDVTTWDEVFNHERCDTWIEDEKSALISSS